MTGLDSEHIDLADGRCLYWAEYGEPTGTPVCYFHGGPGSRRPTVPRQSEIAAELGIRLICPERPGFGDSTRHPDRTMLSWANDVAALGDALDLERFAVIGYSAGGPFALACAAGIGDRLTRAVTVGCGAPWDAPELASRMDWPRRSLRFLAQRAPWLLRLTYRTLPDPNRHPEKLVRQMLAGLPETDRMVLARPEIFEIGVEQTTAGVRTNGFDGMADEVLLLARSWGFDLESIEVPVTLWCGTEDRAAPLTHAEHLAARIPGAELRPLEGEGHLCIFGHWAEVLRSARTCR